MKYLTIIILLCSLGMLTSCGGDDDICESGEGTPRMKIMFKKAGKETRLDSIKVFVNYGSNIVDFGWQRNVDSVFVPLRVDDSPYTDLFIKTTTTADSSKVRVNYTTKSIYVSPGCGMKRNYENLQSQLLLPTTVVSVEPGQNFIENEEKTNLYLNF
ncbi:DUF6452 family protein [Chryseobacterium gwangjuense]|uniref:DUF6452 family protein n=1 Tax=Chryseobacterium gwangjuense TaxID=1069980 RepID=UPI001E5E2734|nr:DUF6452 family protein [Chryseobacterium gwangjuense]MCE3077159.1 DUF6452 family protein [Chryseobacterium gwangjuense]